VVAALEEAGGDIDRAAEILGVSRTTFWRMRKRAGVL
jgi:transcriptional regulator of acetoin/glycerol metabolism